MGIHKFIRSGFLVFGLFFSQFSFAQTADLIRLLDSATSLQAKGDKDNLAKVLTSAASGVEAQAGETKNSFGKKLLSQAGLLKQLIPLASKGLVQKNTLGKIVSTIKVLLGAGKISSLLGSGSSLIGQAAGLKSNLGLIQAGMSVLGNGSGQKLGTLVSAALGTVGKIEKGGITAKATEPLLKNQLTGITDTLKNLL